MGELRLPGGLVLPNARFDVPLIKCARRGCENRTIRRVRAEDNPTPAPSDPGWVEVELRDAEKRTVLLCCSMRCGVAVQSQVSPGIKAIAGELVLPPSA